MGHIRIQKIRDPGVIMYLVLVDQMIARHRDLVMARPTEKFETMVQKEIMSHVIDGKEPPMQIRSAILNMADDMMAGRDVTMRAGDYIDLMNYAREQKLL